jgi:hypothetical protein
MKFKLPKRYGEYQVKRCAFCGKIATCKNKQGVDTCSLHQRENLGDIKCVCGEYLELKEGKFGAYYHCINCGNMNMSKALSMKKPEPLVQQKKEQPKQRKEITIDSNDPNYF